MATSQTTANTQHDLLSRRAQQKAVEQQYYADKARYAAEKSSVNEFAPPEERATPTLEIEHAYNSKVVGDPSDPSGGLMEALTQYCETYSAQEPPLLSRLREATLAHYAGSPGATRMLCDPLQGRVLALLVTLTQARHVLELGAFTGYSALCLAQGLDAAEGEERQRRKVTSCEPDSIAREIALKFIAEAGLQDRIDLRHSKAMDVIESLRADPACEPLDLVFLDADKKQYKQYLLALMGDVIEGGAPSKALLRDGALIVVDNTLWKGLVLEHAVIRCSTQSPVFVFNNCVAFI